MTRWIKAKTATRETDPFLPKNANPLHSSSLTIYSDSLAGLLVTMPAGLEIMQTRKTSISVSVIPEAYVFAGMTNTGFKNDYFMPFASIKLAFEADYSIN